MDGDRNRDYQTIIDEVAVKARTEIGRGKKADYIPALANVPSEKFGIAVCSVDGQEWTAGDALEEFSIQSISKVFSLLLALDTIGDELWTRVGREPSGTRFNSLIQLETENGIPRNPFINAGALVVTDCIVMHSIAGIQRIKSFIGNLARHPAIRIDEQVAQSELEHGHWNAAIAHFLKAHGNLNADVDEVLNTYCRQCAISMTCLDLARAFLPLANKGIMTGTGEPVFPSLRTRRINSLLLTCGLYDGVGNFAFRVGIPAKSGVGGGIVAVIPSELTICVWSPELDEVGNSLAGTAALEHFAEITSHSIFV